MKAYCWTIEEGAADDDEGVYCPYCCGTDAEALCAVGEWNVWCVPEGTVPPETALYIVDDGCAAWYDEYGDNAAEAGSWAGEYSPVVVVVIALSIEPAAAAAAADDDDDGYLACCCCCCGTDEL